MFDLKAINPGLYENWLLVKDAPPEFHSPPDPAAVRELEVLAGGQLPQDYKDFLLEFGDVGGSINTGVMFFRSQYPDKEIIESDFGLISGAQHTLASTRILSKPHITLPDVGPRIPSNMIATNVDNYRTFLIDLRLESFGQIYFIPKLKRQTFGTPGYDWKNVAFVGKSFTDFIAAVGTKDELKAKYPKLKVV